MENREKWYRRNSQILFISIGLLLECIIFSLATDNFLSSKNIINVLLQNSVAVIVAIAQTYVIASGMIDLSVGSTAAMAGMAVALLIRGGMPYGIAMLLAVLMGVACGVLNSFVVTILGIVPFIATLGTNYLLRGIILLVMNGIPISGLDPDFGWIGNGRIGDVLPYPVIWMSVVVVVMAVILRKMRLGRDIFAIGSNEQAAFLSGVDVKKTKWLVYLVSGTLCGIAGVILTSRLSSAAPTACEGYDTTAIAATVIGGASLRGGKGSIAGTIIGAFIIGVLTNGLNLLALNYYWQQVAVGIVIILAVFLDVLRTKIEKGQ